LRNDAKKIMSTELTIIRLHDPIKKAFEVMQEAGIRHLPVIEATGKLVGMISDRDIRRAMTPKPGSEISTWETSSVEFNPAHKVSDFMSWPTRVISEATPLTEVIRKMLDEKLSSLLVTARDGKFPRGIITTDDLLLKLLELLESEEGGSPIFVDSLKYQTFPS